MFPPGNVNAAANLKEISLAFKSVYSYDVLCVWHRWEAEDDPVESVLSSYLHVSSRDQTRAARLVWQAPLLAELF